MAYSVQGLTTRLRFSLLWLIMMADLSTVTQHVPTATAGVPEGDVAVGVVPAIAIHTCTCHATFTPPFN